MDDSQIKDYNEGRMLEAVRPHLTPLLEAQRVQAEANLLQAFRSGADEREIYCHVAKLAVLQDLNTQINQKTQAAMQLQKEIPNV